MSGFNSSRTYGPLWRLLDIPDEAVVHMMETSLRRAGVYSLDDLAFLSTKDVDFPPTVKPVFVRKFRTICEYYALGHKLSENSTMQDVLIQMNPRLRANQARSHAPAPIPTPVYAPPSPPPPPPPSPPPPPPPPPQTRPNRHLNVVIIGDCAPYQPGWEHLQQFSLITSCRIHSIINSGRTDESLLIQCRTRNIRLHTKISDLSVPQPNLFILGSTRLHDVFQIMDLFHPPSALLLDLPGTITHKSLQALQACSNDHACPIYLNLPRVVAPYVQRTLNVASSMEPKVTWYHKQDIALAHMAEVFSRGRLLHTTALDEMVICVMYFGVKLESVARWQVNPGLTERRTIDGITDFTRAAFCVYTHSGVQVSVVVDRNAPVAACLGVVADDQGRVLQQFDHFHGNCDLKLKRRLVRSLMDESTEILPSIRMGIEALRLAEMAEKHLNKVYDELTKPEKKGTGLLQMLSRGK